MRITEAQLGQFAGSQRAEFERRLAAVEAFSLGELLPGLAGGDASPQPATEALYQRLASVAGLPPDLVRRHAGRIPREVFAKELLRAHSWPGNIRELEHVVERAVLLAKGAVIGAADLQLEDDEVAAPPSAVAA